MLDKGQEEDWFSSHFITWIAAFAVIGLGAFIFNEFIQDHPVVDLRVFKERTYAVGVTLMTSLGFVLYGSTVLLPIFLQSLLGYSAYDAGVAMLPRGLGSFIAMPIVGMLMGKFDPRKLLTLGFLVAAFAMWRLSAINLNAGYWDIFWPQFIQGTSLGFLFVPLTTVTHDPIPKSQMGNATSLFNVMRNIGGSVGIALVTTIVTRVTQSNSAQMVRNVTVFNPAAQNMFNAARAGFIAKGADPVTATQRAQAALFGTVQQQAAMLANIHAFRFLGILFLAVTPLILLMKKPSHKGGAPMAH
jgi:DHA2 family multidrug resistance protein